MKYIIANWKSNMSYEEINSWIETFKLSLEELVRLQDQVSIILCPPFTFTETFNTHFADVSMISIGVQNISHLGAGSFTGEVSGKNLEGLAAFSLIGHSERRQNFGETDDILQAKVEDALAHYIEPIYCIRGEQDSIPDTVQFVAYEPIEAIGTGENMPADDVVEFKAQLNLHNDVVFIYGGSVSAETVAEYIGQPEIHGVLLGKASLDAASFATLVRNAASALTSTESVPDK